MPSQTGKITFDTVALFSGRAVGLMLGVLRLNYLATYLGVATFGILNFAAYFTALFQSLFDLGLAQLITRDLARDPARSNSLLGRTVLLKVLVVVVAGGVMGMVVLFSHFDPVTDLAILLTTVALAINGISQVFLGAFQAHRKMVLVSAVNIVNDAILSAVIVILLPSFPDIVTALLLTVAVAVINLAILVVIYLRMVGKPEFVVDALIWRMLLKEGTPMAVSALGISTYTFIGPTLLKYYRGEVEVGLYSAGYKLISILTLIPVAVTQVVYPIFSDFFANSPDKLQKSLRDSLRAMMQISIPLAVGTIVLAPDIIQRLYPVQYSDAATVLRILVAGSSLGYPAWVLYSFLLANNRHSICMWNSIGVGTAVILASIVYIPTYGYSSVAYISLGSELFLFVSLLLVVRIMGFHVFSDLTVWGKIVSAALMMGAVVLGLSSIHGVLAVVGGIITYAVLLFAFNTFGDQEKELLKRITRW